MDLTYHFLLHRAEGVLGFLRTGSKSSKYDGVFTQLRGDHGGHDTRVGGVVGIGVETLRHLCMPRLSSGMGIAARA